MMGTMLVLGLLAAGSLAREARAQAPVALPGEPEAWVEPGDDPSGDGPLLALGDFDDGPDVGFGRHGRGMRRGMRAMHRGMGFGPVMAQELGLTAEQQDKIKAARERQERRAIQTRADIQLARLDLRKLTQADKPDQRAIDAQIDKISGLLAGLQKSRMATML